VAVGEYVLHFGTEGLRALTFLSLVFGSQATIYALRERGRLWGSRPSAWLVASSVADVLIAPPWPSSASLWRRRRHIWWPVC
jgi:H+-transporting ATPase